MDSKDPSVISQERADATSPSYFQDAPSGGNATSQGRSKQGLLLGYQKLWVDDDSRFKIGLWSRQVGKSFAGALEAVLDSVKRKTLWVFLSASERQSRELAEKAKLHLEALKVATEALEDRFFDGVLSVAQLELRLPNGSRMIFLPANPRTARGFTGNVFLDEFAFHQDSSAIWAALYPIITRRPDLKIRVMSTPNGKTGKFFELWENAPADVWSKHRVTILDAAEQGLGIDVNELREGLNDDLVWQQEFMLEFVSENEAFIPYHLIMAAEVKDISNDWDENAKTFLGMDIGRKRDLTVLIVIEKVGDVYWMRTLERLKNTLFSEQRTLLESFMARVTRGCMDATGLGMQLAEEARRKFGWRVEPVTFTNEVKADLAQNLRLAFEDSRIRIPKDSKLREALHSVRRIVTASGNVRYDADRTEGGHADEFWALALAFHAAETKHGRAEYKTIVASSFAGKPGLF